jgi:heterodisulfide reductase subunit B
MKISFFTGCVIPVRYPGMEASIRDIAEKLRIDLADLNFGCCPTPSGLKEIHFDSWLALAGRNLCLAEEKGLDIVTPCSGCANTLKETRHILSEDSVKLKSIQDVLSKQGREYRGTAEVFNISDLLSRDEYLDIIEKKLVNPLTNMKIGTHYGCHYLRPSKLRDGEDSSLELTETMELILESLGCEVVEYGRPELCCGASLGINTGKPEEALKVTAEKLFWMNYAEIDGLVVTCPACFTQFDTGQALLKRKDQKMRTFPVFHIAEIVAYALGVTYERLDFKSHRIEPAIIKSRIG